MCNSDDIYYWFAGIAMGLLALAFTVFVGCACYCMIVDEGLKQSDAALICTVSPYTNPDD